jgi:hypothetical protein
MQSLQVDIRQLFGAKREKLFVAKEIHSVWLVSGGDLAVTNRKWFA